MMTLLQSALTGWTDYTQHGKFAALLLLAILYLGFVLYGSGKEANASGAEKARKRLYLYGALVTFGCICPVTALILLKYQTAFYSYVWIWAAVPQTALIAWAATDFLCNLLKEKSLRNGMAALILLGILFLLLVLAMRYRHIVRFVRMPPVEVFKRLLEIRHTGERGN